MKIPEFTAQNSLYRTGNHYRSLGQRGEPQRTVVNPQLGGPEFKGFQGCINDCMDNNPYWTRARCERSCRDPGHAGISSNSSFNDFLSNIGIDFWEAGCSALLNPYLCGKVADEIRRQS